MITTIPATNGHDTWSNPGRSRAMNVTATRSEVEALCVKQNTKISAIETLPRGGTRAVMMNGDDAAIMRRAFGKALIVGEVERVHWARDRR